jgi:hypothetical protein
LLVLAAILGGWFVLRIVLWQPLFDPAGFVSKLHFASHAAVPAMGRIPAANGVPAQLFVRTVRSVPGQVDAPNSQPLPTPWFTTLAPVSDLSPAAMPVRREIGQQLLLAAAFAHMALPPEIAAHFAPVRAQAAPLLASGQPLIGRNAGPPANGSRWSGDGWLLLRDDRRGPLAAGVPSYGRSQAGSVLRYQLMPSSGHRPVAYARVTRALAGPREAEAAAGLSIRPLARVPLSLAAEVRVSEGSAGREVRPAAFAVTELPPAELPFGLRGEGYAQAGYVGGRFATAFVDGQARLDGRLARLDEDEDEVRAGAGVWGGAQEHAERLDIGPSATASFRLGDTRSRVAIDYRVRVAGDARPKSGPALTISAGF